MTNSEFVYIFDVDGTLTDERYIDDNVSDLRPNYPILEIAISLASQGRKVAVVTARPHYLFEETKGWLHEKGLYPQFLITRQEGDFRSDSEVRVDQVRMVMEILGKNATLFDDRLSNCLLVNVLLGVPYIHVKSHDKTYN